MSKVTSLAQVIEKVQDGMTVRHSVFPSLFKTREFELHPQSYSMVY